MRLKASTVIRMAKPGKVTTHQALCTNCIALASMLPHSGVGGWAPEWGTMLANALQFIQRAWWVVTFPGLAILITVLAFNLLGDGLRDALDPKMKR